MAGEKLTPDAETELLKAYRALFPEAERAERTLPPRFGTSK